MALQVHLGKTNKKKSSTRVPGGLNLILPCLLKENTSIIRPTLLLRVGMTDVAQFNYAYVPEFKRYYFVVNTRHITNSTVELECEVDVLATFRSDILATRAFVVYAQNGYDMSLPDSRLHRSINFTTRTSTVNIPHFDYDGCCVVTVVSEDSSGELGVAESFALNASKMKEFAAKLFSKDFLVEFEKYLLNPMQAVVACKWTPITYGHALSGISKSMDLAGFHIGNGGIAKKRVTGTVSISPNVRYDASDYRNSEPWSDYQIYLPGVGIVALSYEMFGDSINVTYTASPISGDVNYMLSTSGFDNSFLSASGNFGVDIPMASGGAKIGSALSSAAASLGTTVMSSVGALTGNIPLMMGSMVSGVSLGAAAAVAGATKVMSVQGTISGLAMTEKMINTIFILTRNYEQSDEPEDVASTIGLPVYASKQLSECSGLVKCVGAHVQTWATSEEHDIIAQMVNNSANYIYGGIYIE